MNTNVLQKVITFVFRYIWILCGVLIVIETLSTGYTSMLLLEETSQSMLYSVSGEISERVNSTIKMLTALSNDEFFSDTDIPIYDRAMRAIPYRDAYGLYMVAFTDENVYVSSTNDPERPVEGEEYSLSYRDYMQRLYATGTPQITDAFLSGDKMDTLNYTIAVPIMKDGKVAGSVFGSIHFDTLDDIISRSRKGDEKFFALLSSDLKIMSQAKEERVGKSIDVELSEGIFFGTSYEEIMSDLKSRKSGHCWAMGNSGINYMSYQNILYTDWTIIYSVSMISVMSQLLPMLLTKLAAYILLCLFISIFCRRYLMHQLQAVDHLMHRLTNMQKILFDSETSPEGGSDYGQVLHLAERGLVDQLTGLHTRAVMVDIARQGVLSGTPGALMFIDLDDLKRINDTFGHEAGDCALTHFASVLKEHSEKYGSIAARYGGDEFVLVVKNINTAVEFQKMADELCSKLRTDLELSGKKFSIHGSIGAALFPAHGDNIELLISKADLALYSAKQSGKNRFQLYGSIK